MMADAATKASQFSSGMMQSPPFGLWSKPPKAPGIKPNFRRLCRFVIQRTKGLLLPLHRLCKIVI